MKPHSFTWAQNSQQNKPLLPLFLVTSDEGGKSNGAKVYAHQMVRTDSREQTLHAFLPPKDHAVKSNESNRYKGDFSI